VHKGYGNRSIYDGFDFVVRRRERWCVMGVNGAGKSTLLKLVAGSTEAGRRHGGGRRQRQDGLLSRSTPWICSTASHTVFESLEDSFPQAGQGSLRALAGCFGFSGDETWKEAVPGAVRAARKARLVMAKMLYDPPKFFWCWDEPTNHLDMATKEMLINALSQYEGSMLFVSHEPALFWPRFPTGCWN